MVVTVPDGNGGSGGDMRAHVLTAEIAHAADGAEVSWRRSVPMVCVLGGGVVVLTRWVWGDVRPYHGDRKLGATVVGRGTRR